MKKTTGMYDYDDDRPGRFEGYGHDYRSLYIGILLIVIVAGALLMDFISRNQSPESVNPMTPIQSIDP